MKKRILLVCALFISLNALWTQEKSVNPIDEIERTVIALQTSDKENVLTPGNWKPGEDVFLPYPDKKATADGSAYTIAPFIIAKKRP